MDELIERLRDGCVLRPKRWSGDTHDDLGGSIDEAATDSLLREAAAALEAAVSDVVWTPADDAAAAAAGWVVSNTSDGFDEIQRLDEAEVFHEDAAAIAHVYWMAGTGSELHRRAILYTLRDGNAWAYPP